MTSIEGATALIARCLPRRVASRRYCALRSVLLGRAAAWAAWTHTVRKQRWPWRVVPDRRFPARA